MESNLNLKNGKIHYKVLGQGDCVLLLHGYLENLNIWDGLVDEFAKTFKVLTLDLPGHGSSEISATDISVEDMAISIDEVLSYLNISKAAIIGHSMGGYVALAFAELYTNKTAGLCLLHSSPNADSPDKKQSRYQDIETVKNGQKGLIVESGVPIRFANDNLITLSSEVDKAKEMALSTTDIGFISALKAMAMRSDRNFVLENAKFPTQMIFGVHDNLIPVGVSKELEMRHKKTRTDYLANSGHMGFIEEQDQALKAICSFLATVFS
jgi:pimeloyl-ACP methyl ester carboxylesterase